MSWLYSRALVEAFSAATCSAGAPSAPSRSTPTPQAYLSPDRMTAFSRPSRFGMTFGPSTDIPGEDLLTWYRAGFLASRSALPVGGVASPAICGPRCCGSSERVSRGGSVPKTCNAVRSGEQSATLSHSDTLPGLGCCLPEALARCTIVPGGGWLPTPTATANHDAPSMQKWPAYRRYQDWTGGRTMAAHWEFLMMMPLGWTALEPLETGRFHEWRQQHGGF